MTVKPTVLLVDDDEEIRTQMKWALADAYTVLVANDRPEALQQVRDFKPLAILLDLGLPPHPNSTEEGLAALSEILATDASAKIIIVSGQSDKKHARQAIAAGAYDFLCKPVDIEELQLVLHRGIYLAELEAEYRDLQQSVEPKVFEGMLAGSAEMKLVFAHIRKVAQSTVPVLILGESGTGKEMVANAIHRQSTFKDGPFIAINCSAIPENLIESELFGYEKGSFTGADKQRKGLIESAAEGTLFLDEIGDLPPAIQVKLLRFLQEKTFQRVGGRKELNVNARIVAATHVDLEQSVKDGKVREDLYFRLAVIVLNLPALRNRGDDGSMLAQELLNRFAAENGKHDLAFAPEALSAIRKYSWPGNVRELQNRLQRAVIMAPRKYITGEDLELTQRLPVNPIGTLKAAREALERTMIQQALELHGGKISAVAKALGVTRPTLYELMKKLAINRKPKSTKTL